MSGNLMMPTGGQTLNELKLDAVSLTQKGQEAANATTGQGQKSFSNAIEKQKASIESARLTLEQLSKIISINSGSPWPQIKPDSAVGGAMGFLPSVLLQPTLQTGPVSGQTNEGRGSGGEVVTKQTYANYKFQDWRGQMIETTGIPWPQTTINPGFSNTKGFLPSKLIPPIKDSEGVKPYDSQYPIDDWGGQKLNTPTKYIDTADRFYAGKDLPRENPVLVDKPHSRRDVDLIFGDGRSDYFRHGLQVIGDGKAVSNLTPIENPSTGASTLRLDHFKETPWENEDPPMFGFDIIFDSYSSPLLNGSLSDFILNYSNVSEILSKRQVYEEFKNQFQKFFRINGEMKVDPTQIAMTSLYSSVAAADSSSPLFNPHKKNYLGHYLKKISGLDFLIEQNKGDTIKYTPDYKKDFITLDFREDVSMNLGTLAHLYKTLYWSKPNGKMLIPENLLRFNCIIIVSECRNFQRVKKGIKNPENINIIKDNLSRYVYTLRECQFYFDKMPLPNEIDMGDQGPQMFENYSLNFDFKYSSVKLERFVPNGDWGNYVGIDGGSIWKVGNKGTRNSRGQTGSQELSTPKFFTVGPDNENYTYYPNLKINGEEKPYIMAVYGPKADQADDFPLAQKKSSEGTLGATNEGTGGQNLGELGAGNTGTTEQGTTTTTGGGAIPGGGTIPTEGSGSGATIDNLKKQSEQVSSEAQQQSQDVNTKEALDNLKTKSSAASEQIQMTTETLSIKSVTSGFKKISPSAIAGQLSNASLSKVTKAIGTPLSQVVANKSISSDIVSGKFFDKMGSLKIEDSLKGLAGGGLSNLTSGLGNALSGGLSGGLSGLKSAIPSLDSVKTKFSEAKSKATSGFFDIRGNLKSSLTEGATKLKSGGGLFGGLSNQAEGLFGDLKSKITSAVPSLDSVKTKFSEAKTQAKSGFFDIRGNLKSSLTDGASKLKSGGLFGGLSNQAEGLLGGLTSKIKGAVPSLDSVKTKFSEAKTQASTGFFDVRGNLKSSLTDGANKLKGGGLFSGLSNQAEGLLGGLSSKIKSAVPSLDSVKTKFSDAKTQASTGFFDIRGNLKSSLTDGATKLKSGGGLFGGLSNQAEGLFGDLKSKITSAVPSLDSVKTKFSDAKTQASTGFFDVRGNLKSSLTDGATKLKSGGGLFSGLSEQAEGLFGGLSSKITSAVPDLSSVKTKFSAAISQPSTGFFDVRGNLKSSLTEGAKILTSFDKAVDDANSLTEQVSKKKNDTINLVKGLLNKEVEESKNNIGGFISVDNLKEKFTNATEIPSSSFFDVRGQMSGDKGKDTSSLNLRKNLLNNTIDKIYNTTKTGTSPIKNNTPPPTSFFDLKNQLKDFLGGKLGDKLTE